MSDVTKQLVEKFVDEEITPEQFETEKSKLSPEEQTGIDEELAKKKKELLKEVIGLRGAKKAITSDKDTGLAEKMRQENYESAKTEFFSSIGIDKDEDKKAFEEGFKKFDTGNVNVPNILKDMKAYYASTKSDEFFTLKEQQKQRQSEADEYNAQNAGANGSGGGSDPTKKVSKEVKDFIEATRKATGRVLTPEQAEKRLNIAKGGGHIG